MLPSEDDRYLAPKHGLNLKLTIDMRLQTIVEQELDKGMRHFRAKRGCMIVVDPKTGDILAMVSRPAFALSKEKELITPQGKFKRGTLKDDNGKPITGEFNFACQTRYEPGSTFKVLAVTAAVDKGLMSIHSYVNCSPFSVGFGSKAISDRPFNYGSLPMWGVLKKSSNPGAARIAIIAKWPNFKEYLEKYGLHKPVGIDLPSGGACLLADGSNIVNYSRIAYGYSVAVSPLHMAMVYATIAPMIIFVMNITFERFSTIICFEDNRAACRHIEEPFRCLQQFTEDVLRNVARRHVVICVIPNDKARR